MQFIGQCQYITCFELYYIKKLVFARHLLRIYIKERSAHRSAQCMVNQIKRIPSPDKTMARLRINT